MAPRWNMLHIMKMETPRGLLMGELRRGKKGKNSHGANRFCVKSKYIVDLFSCQMSILMVTNQALGFCCQGQGHNPVSRLWRSLIPSAFRLYKGHKEQQQKALGTSWGQTQQCSVVSVVSG